MLSAGWRRCPDAAPSPSPSAPSLERQSAGNSLSRYKRWGNPEETNSASADSALFSWIQIRIIGGKTIGFERYGGLVTSGQCPFH